MQDHYFMIQLIVFLLVSWFSACLNWINLKNHLKSRQIKAEIVFYSVLIGLLWRISHDQYKSKFDRVWRYLRLIIMKNQLRSIQIKAWRIFDWITLKNQLQAMWIKENKSKFETVQIYLLQSDHYEELVKINSNQSMKIFLLCFN